MRKAPSKGGLVSALHLVAILVVAAARPAEHVLVGVGAVEANREAGRVAHVVNLGCVAHRLSPSVLLLSFWGQHYPPPDTGGKRGAWARFQSASYPEASSAHAFIVR